MTKVVIIHLIIIIIVPVVLIIIMTATLLLLLLLLLLPADDSKDAYCRAKCEALIVVDSASDSFPRFWHYINLIVCMYV